MATKAFLLSLNFDLPPKFNLFAGLRNAFIHHFQTEHFYDLVKAILPKSSRQFIVFVGVEIANLFDLTSQSFTIAGPITGNFISLNSSHVTEIIITKTSNKGSPNNLVKTLCTEYSLKCAATFSRYDEMIFVMNNNALGLSKFINRLSQSIHTERVALADHRCVDFYWRGDVSFADAGAKLRSAGLSFTTLIRSALSLRVQQPCIISVQEIPPYVSAVSLQATLQPNLVLVCCNEVDENIVRRIGRIHLAEGIYICSDPYETTEMDYTCPDPSSTATLSEQTCLSDNLYKSLRALASNPSTSEHKHPQSWPLLSQQQRIFDEDGNLIKNGGDVNVNGGRDGAPNAKINVNGSGKESPLQLQLHLQQQDSRRQACAYIFWDIEASPLDPDDNVADISTAILQMMIDTFKSYCSQMRILKPDDFSGVITKVIYKSATNVESATTNQIMDLSRLKYQIIQSQDSNCSLQNVMETHLNAVVNHHKNDLFKPIIVIFLDEDSVLSSIISMCLAGFPDVLLLSRGNEKHALHFPRCSWKDIKHLASNQITKQQRQPQSFLQALYSELSPSQRPPPLSTPPSMIVNVNDDGSQTFGEKVSASHYIVALHLKHLQEWERLCKLLGDPCTSTPSFSIHYSIGIKKKTQTLTVTCKTPAETISFSSKLKDLISQITSTLEQRTLHRWHIQHREAFMKSEPLGAIEKLTQTTALFYNNDNNQVVVEMVSLNMLNLVQFWDHLEKFAPDEDNLHIPSKFKFTEQEMALIRKMYAIVTDNSSAHKWRTTTKVWGFKNDGLFNKGKKVLLGVLKPPEIPQQNQDQKLSRPSSPTALASPSVTSSSSITTADNTTSETASSALQLIEQTRTNFRFKTREAGIFYQTFESTTRAYIENISGISIDKLDKSRASKSSSNIMQTTVSLLGSKEQTKVAKDYLKNLQSSLTHMQTLFLKVSMQKYKQLHEVKLAFETCHIHPNCDPLLVSQIVSVRLKPPLNTRGLKKMEFPCDVWATVCGPNSSYVTEVQELLEKLSNPFDTRISYINKTGLLNSIIQDNSTRKEFVEYYNLCGVRANDSIKNGAEQIKLYVWSNNLDQRQDLQAILDQASKVSNNTCDDDGSEVVTSHSDLPSGPVSELESVPSAYNSDNNDDDDTSYDSAYSGLCYDSDSSNNNCEKSSAASKRSESQLPPYTSHEINTDNVEKDSMSQVARVLNDMTSQVILKETLAPCASLLRKTAEAGSNSRSHQYAEGGQYDEDIHSFLACVKLHQQNFGTTDIASLIKKQIYQSGVEESTDRSANLFLELDRSLTAMGGLHGLHPLNKDDEITE